MGKRTQKTANSRMGLVAVLAVGAAALVIGIATWSTRQGQEAAGRHDGFSNAKGSQNAKVVITEYGDYQ